MSRRRPRTSQCSPGSSRACWPRRARLPASTSRHPFPPLHGCSPTHQRCAHTLTGAVQHGPGLCELPAVVRPDRHPAGPRSDAVGQLHEHDPKARPPHRGVSADTLLLGSRNPVSGRIEGFDIDMLHAVSQAIFNDPDKIELRVITAAQRLPVLKDGSVDIVARNMTITCARWKEIAFSSEYYRSGQKLMVRLGEKTKSGAKISGIQDLAGKKVCAPNGSTSMDKLRTFEDLQPVGADTHTGCLVLFQQGKVDAITGDDTVLAGLAAQDPYVEVVQAPAFTAEPYGLGINRANIDFVRFVNGVLATMRSNGQWTKSYNTWLADALGTAPSPPAPVYGRAS